MELPLQQCPAFATALRRIGRDTHQIDMPGAAPLQIIKRFGLSFAARGPIWSDKPNLTALRKSGPRIINSNDPTDLRPAGYRQIMTAGSVAERDLRDPKAPHAKWRYNLRKAQAANLRVEMSSFSPKHHWLLDADSRLQKTKGFRALPHALIHAYAAAHPHDVIVMTACQKRTPIAGMLFLCHHPVVTYHIGWSDKAGRQHCAHHLLLTQAASHFAAKGFSRLDLGQIDTDNTPGLARFKIGSGAVVRRLGGTWLRCIA